MAAPRPRLYLIDASMYVFRAYHSLPDTIADPEGWPVQAVYGYAGFLCRLLADERPQYVAAAFDESLVSSFRNELYADYKANRELPPAELERQFGWCRALTEAMGVACYASETYEAEDLLASIARKFRPKGFRMVFVSGDKDLAQLIEPGDLLWDYAKDRKLGHRDIKTAFGVGPAHIPDLLALVGDSIDNIPGVPGIGHKTACALINHLGGLERLYQCLDRVAETGVRGAQRIVRQLTDHRERALLSRRLAVIHDRVSLRAPVKRLTWNGPDAAAVDPLFEALGFGERLRQRCMAVSA